MWSKGLHDEEPSCLLGRLEIAPTRAFWEVFILDESQSPDRFGRGEWRRFLVRLNTS